MAKTSTGSLVRRIAIYSPSVVGLAFFAIFIYLSHWQETRKSADAYIRSGVSHATSGDYDRAIADFSEAIRIDPATSAAFIERGNVYGVKHDFDRASADFTEAMRLDPGHSYYLGLYRRGLLRTKNGDLTGGKADMIAARQALGAAIPR
jgi:tetratricopeptide (TPR) repeat protein